MRDSEVGKPALGSIAPSYSNKTAGEVVVFNLNWKSVLFYPLTKAQLHITSEVGPCVPHKASEDAH